jgi:hypothetical protein
MKGCDSMFSRGIACGCTDLRNGFFQVKVSGSETGARGLSGKFKISRGLAVAAEPNLKFMNTNSTIKSLN